MEDVSEREIERTRTAFLEATSEAPWQNDFFSFVRQLEQLSPDRPRVGESKHYSEDLAYFKQALYLGFAPSTVESVDVAPVSPEGGPRASVSGNFLGLLGPGGPLPLSWSEYIWARCHGVPHPDRIAPGKQGVSLNRRDTSLRDFLNIFNHRFISFFYRAWASNRKTVDYDRPTKSKFIGFLGAFIGLGTEELRNRLACADEVPVYFAGHFSSQARHPAGLEKMIEDYLKVSVNLEENVGHWVRVPPESMTCLGHPDMVDGLGGGIMMGSRFWDRQMRFRLRIGPLGWNEYQRFLPSASQGKEGLLAVIRDLVALYTHRELFCSALVILNRNDIPEPRLGCGGRLGFSLWLHSAPPPKDSDDLEIELSA